MQAKILAKIKSQVPMLDSVLHADLLLCVFLGSLTECALSLLESTGSTAAEAYMCMTVLYIRAAKVTKGSAQLDLDCCVLLRVTHTNLEKQCHNGIRAMLCRQYPEHLQIELQPHAVNIYTGDDEAASDVWAKVLSCLHSLFRSERRFAMFDVCDAGHRPAEVELREQFATLPVY